MRLPRILALLTLLGALVQAPAWAISTDEYNAKLERCMKNDDLDACIELVPVSANDGSIELIIGKKYYFGWGAAKDFGKAASWSRKSADKHNVWANVYLGFMYLSGNGLARDYNKAQQLLMTVPSQPTETGRNPEVAMALNGLGMIYEKGLGVRADQLRALDYYLKAATLNGDSENVLSLFRSYTNLPETEQEKLPKTQVDSVIAIFKKAGGIYQPALKAMPPELLNKKPDELIMASNMPKPSNQTAFPICAGVVAKNLYLQYQCRTQRLDCQQLKPEEIPSSLSVAGVGISEESYELTRSSSVVLYDTSGSTVNSLRKLQEMTKIYTEACMPIEDIWAKKFGSSTAKMREAFDNLKAEYSKNHVKPEPGIDFERWLRELLDVYGITTNETTLRAAVKEDMYEKFLYDIMLKGCKASGNVIKIPGEFERVKIGVWPKGDGAQMSNSERKNLSFTYENYLSTIKERIKENKPLAVGFCMYEPYQKDRECGDDGHVFVVYGYRKDCAAKGNGCKEYFKTMNSWGPDYEKYFSDGWIDASRFYRYTGQGLLWLE